MWLTGCLNLRTNLMLARFACVCVPALRDTDPKVITFSSYQIITSPRPTAAGWNYTSTTVPDIPLGPVITTTNATRTHPFKSPEPCEHIVTTYLIPNILHFMAYIMGLYYFRIQDNEQMYAMMEKVCCVCTAVHACI